MKKTKEPKKRKTLRIAFLLSLCLALFLLAACGTPEEGGTTAPPAGHTHEYTMRRPDVGTSALRAPTCTEDGEYYYICECGENGTETYTVAALGHSFDLEVVSEETFCSDATCQSPALYYLSCSACGTIGTERTFAHGVAEEHFFENNLCIYGCGEEMNSYRLSEDGTYYTLVAFREEVGGTVTIPAEYRGLPVRVIGTHAIQIPGVTEVILPDTVKEIAENAFYHLQALSSINLGRVERIGAYAFSGCAALESVDLSSAVSVGAHAFDSTGLTSVTLPAGLTTVGAGAFSSCEALREVTLGCANATGLDYPDSVFSYSGPFALYVEETAETVPASFFAFAKLSSIQFDADGTYAIGEGAFRSATLPATLVLERVSAVGKEAFLDADGLASLTLGGILESVGDYAFSGCEALASVTINVNRGFGEYMLANTANDLVVYYNYEGTATLAEALYGADAVVVFGADVKTIPDQFLYAAPVSSFRFAPGASGVTIGSYAFYACPLTGDLDLSPVTSIEKYALHTAYGAPNTVTLGAGLTYIGEYAFREVGTLYFGAAQCADRPLALPGSIADGIAERVGILEIGKDVGRVPAALFSGTDIGALRFETGSACVSVGAEAFRYAAIDEILFSDTIRTVEARAFDGVSGTTGVLNLNALTSIGEAAFRHYAGQILLDAPTALSIATEAFQGSGLAGSVAFTVTVSIGEGAFWGCADLVALTLSGALAEIGANAFYNCTAISTVRYDVASGLTLDGDIFNTSGAPFGFALTVGAAVTELPSHIFSHSAVRTVAFLGTALTKIGEGAFSYTDLLVALVLPDSVKEIGAEAFLLSEVECITVGTGIEKIGANAFYVMGVQGREGYGVLEAVIFVADVTMSYSLPVGVAPAAGAPASGTVTFLAGEDADTALANARILYRAEYEYVKN